MPVRESLVAFTLPIIGSDVLDCIVSYLEFLITRLSVVVEMRVRDPWFDGSLCWLLCIAICIAWKFWKLEASDGFTLFGPIGGISL